MTILIIDDVQTDAVYLSSLMANHGHEVITVECPIAGLHLANIQDPSLVLVDYTMPGMNGVEFIRMLRTTRRHRDTAVVMVTGTDRKVVRLAALEAGAVDCLVKPVNPQELEPRMRNLLRLAEAGRQLTENHAPMRKRVSRASAGLSEREVEIVLRLARAARFRDPETADHIRQAASTAQCIARMMGFEEAFCSRLYLAMQMHDIGKLGVSESILRKPGALTARERAAMELHVVYGSEILGGSSSTLLRLAEEIALTHHERWNGSGYPKGLSGSAIPISGRIAAVADVFDALTSWRPYKPAWSVDDALRHIQQEAGHLFDPDCAAALVKVIEPEGVPSRAARPIQRLEADQGP